MWQCGARDPRTFQISRPECDYARREVLEPGACGGQFSVAVRRLDSAVSSPSRDNICRYVIRDIRICRYEKAMEKQKARPCGRPTLSPFYTSATL